MLDKSAIPTGPYCYASHGPMDERGLIKLHGMCPYRERRDGGAYCAYLDSSGDALGMFEDQLKICGVNDDWDGDT
jgi:hypothetical protein